jgi:hypothetical protein
VRHIAFSNGHPPRAPLHALFISVGTAAAVLLTIAGCRTSGRPAAADPIQGLSEMQGREEFGWFVRARLAARQYQQLDDIADSLQSCDLRFGNGASQLSAFYVFGFGEVNDKSDAGTWERHLARIREWRESRPSSRAADIALAFALTERGWAARGGGYAATVSEHGWRGFGGDLEEAREILDQCADSASTSPAWYEGMLNVLHGLGEDSLFVATYKEGVAKFPEYARLYLLMSWHLQPRWFGEPGDWEHFAATCAPQLPDSLRDELYARIVFFQARYVGHIFQDSQGLSWERAQRGCEVLERRWPDSSEGLSLSAYLACEAGQRAEARAAFEKLGNRLDYDVWRGESAFLAARRWATSG